MHFSDSIILYTIQAGGLISRRLLVSSMRIVLANCYVCATSFSIVQTFNISLSILIEVSVAEYSLLAARSESKCIQLTECIYPVYGMP